MKKTTTEYPDIPISWIEHKVMEMVAINRRYSSEYAAIVYAIIKDWRDEYDREVQTSRN